MTLLLPLGLLALLTLPIILILHLLGERRRRQVVPSLMLWRGVPVRPEGARWKMLPITLLLLLHLLAAALLGLALARPQLAGLPSEGARHTALLIDTSTSMAAREGSQTRLDMAKAHARSLISGLRPGDRMTIVTVGPQSSVLAEGASADAPLLSAALDRVQPGGVGADFEGGLTLAEMALQPGRSRRIVAMSDSASAQLAPRQLGVPFEWITVGSDQPNRAIVTFATRSWGTKLQAYARIANYSSLPFPTTLRLYGDEQLIGTDIVPLEPDGEFELTWSLPASVGDLRLELDGSDVLPDDDRAFLSVRPARPVTALLVSGQPVALQRALLAIPGVELTTIDPAAYTPEQSALADLTIFDGILPAAWPAGATLAISPPAGSGLLEVSDALQAVSSEALVRHGPLLDGLSFSGVRFGDTRPIQSPEWATVLLATRDQALDEQGRVVTRETPLVLRGRVDGHDIAVWSFELANGNLPSRLAFPLLVSRTVRDLTASPPPAGVVAGAPLALRPSPRSDTVAVIGPDGSDDLVAAQAAVRLEGLLRPGFYRIEERSGAQVLYSALVGVSAGSPSESRIAPQAAPPVSGPDRDPGGGGPQRQPLDLWPWLVATALAILTLEWLYVLRR